MITVTGGGIRGGERGARNGEKVHKGNGRKVGAAYFLAFLLEVGPQFQALLDRILFLLLGQVRVGGVV